MPNTNKHPATLLSFRGFAAGVPLLLGLLSSGCLQQDSAANGQDAADAPHETLTITSTQTADGAGTTPADPVPARQALSVSTDPDRAVDEQSLVTVHGGASNGTGAVTYQWTQISGPSVTMNNTDSAILDFQAPAIARLNMSAPVSYPTGDRSIGIDIGDLNGDGIADMAVANFGWRPSDGFRDNSVSVLLGKADGGFLDTVNYFVGVYPYSVKIGDLNHDGHPDLVTANAGSDNVTVLINQGDGTFADEVNYAVGGGPWYADIGDVNGDGHPDLATGNEWDDNASVLIGRGDGTFDSAAHYYAGDRSLVAIIGDYNKDGKPDLAVTNQESMDVSMLIGYGDGTFSTPVAAYPVQGDPRSLAKGDLNDDGNGDFVVANEDSDSISVLLGRGDGSFQNTVHYTVGEAPRWAAIGDLDGDGRLDIAVANRSSHDISILLGNGDGGLKAPVTYALEDLVSPYGIAIGDLNGDGRNDIATANYRGHNSSVLLNLSNTPRNPVDLVFRLTAVDAGNTSSSAEITVSVQPLW